MSTETKKAALYATRDIEPLFEHYLRHVAAMTDERLHEKSAIAAELAWRDAEIERLKAVMSGTGARTYALVHEYYDGVTARVFHYVPTDDKPHPEIEKVVRALDISFEPWAGESVQLVSIDPDTEILTAEAVGVAHLMDTHLNESNPGGFEDPDVLAQELFDEDEADAQAEADAFNQIEDKEDDEL